MFLSCLLLHAREIELCERVGKRAADFLAGVEDVERVEDLFHFEEKRVHLGAEHLLDIGRADETVVVLARDRAMVFDDEVIDLVR